MTRRVLAVVTNENKYHTDESTPTGLWLSELTHFLEEFEGSGIEVDFVSPRGGRSPLEPKSLKWPMLDSSARKYLNNKTFMDKLNSTLVAEKIDPNAYSAIYYTGGHGVMFDFYENQALQEIARQIYESGRILSSVCHGYCGLLNIKLASDEYLIKGKTLTGFSALEEKLAGVSKKIPYDAEKEAKMRGADFQKGFVPFLPYVKVDKNLITGQNPASAKLTAKEVLKAVRSL